MSDKIEQIIPDDAAEPAKLFDEQMLRRIEECQSHLKCSRTEARVVTEVMGKDMICLDRLVRCRASLEGRDLARELAARLTEPCSYRVEAGLPGLMDEVRRQLVLPDEEPDLCEGTPYEVRAGEGLGAKDETGWLLVYGRDEKGGDAGYIIRHEWEDSDGRRFVFKPSISDRWACSAAELRELADLVDRFVKHHG